MATSGPWTAQLWPHAPQATPPHLVVPVALGAQAPLGEQAVVVGAVMSGVVVVAVVVVMREVAVQPHWPSLCQQG